MAANGHLIFPHKFGVKDLGKAQLDSFSLAHMALSGELSLEAFLQHGFFLVTVRCALHVSVVWLLSHPPRLTLQGPNMGYCQGNHTAWLPRSKKHNDSVLATIFNWSDQTQGHSYSRG